MHWERAYHSPPPVEALIFGTMSKPMKIVTGGVEINEYGQDEVQAAEFTGSEATSLRPYLLG